MEQEPIKKETSSKGSYLTGILGAIVGGVIATIPWILVYVYGEMMFSILAALIAAGELYGYKIAKGKINKKLPVILMGIALVIVTVTTLVIIPTLLIANEGISVNLTNISRLYENGEFATAMMKDFIISLIFTILGASIVTANIKKQLENNDGQDVKLNFNNKEKANEIKKATIELIKPIFTKYEATAPEKAMLKDEVIAEIDDKRKAKYSFNYLKQMGIIKKYKGKYYYSEDDENGTNNYKKMSKLQKISLIVLLILIVLVMIVTIIEKSDTTVTYQDSNINFAIQKNWSKGQSQYQNEWNFYKYINNMPVLDSNNEIEEDDYSSYPAGINVYYDKLDTTSVNNIEDIKTTVQENLENADDKPDLINMEILKTSKNYDLLKIRIEYNQSPSEILYYYYILNGDNLACITAYSFNLDDETAIEKEANNLSNSFEWVQ
ncbi:putative reductive dehalogenase anchoring protein [Clostridium sp. CAG:389]|nr:putative reductive dehalogenase anchoring protein [Clostridium sp. CAG:389]